LTPAGGGGSRHGRVLQAAVLLAGALLLVQAWPAIERAALAPALMRPALELAAALPRAAAWGLAALLAVRALDAFVWRGLAAGPGGRPPPRLLVDLVAALVWLSAGLVVAAGVFHLPVAAVVATSGVTVGVVGFALRDLLGSLFAGIALNIERPLQIGDWIEPEDCPAGRVVEIGWLTTRTVTRDGVGVVVPNARLATRPFRNYSRPETHIRDSFAVTLDHDVAPDRVERLLLAAAAEVAEVGPPGPAPDVRIAEFGPHGIVWQLRFWLGADADGPEVHYRLQRAVLRHLRQAGVSLAYAKLDLFHAEMPARSLDPDHAAEALLARCEVLAPLDEADLAGLAKAARQRRLPAETVLLREGEPGSSLLIVVEGVLDVWREAAAPGGRRVWLNAIGAGGVLGEFSLLTGEPRSATVTVKRDALLLEIGRDALAPVLERRPELVEALGRALAERRARSDALTAAASSADAPAAGTDHEGRWRQRIRAFFGL
jgi:small-conductance mechanosensitive channel/CRP-like cAMP-binding protein